MQFYAQHIWVIMLSAVCFKLVLIKLGTDHLSFGRLRNTHSQLDVKGLALKFCKY